MLSRRVTSGTGTIRLEIVKDGKSQYYWRLNGTDDELAGATILFR